MVLLEQKFYYKDVKSGENGLWGTAVPKPWTVFSSLLLDSLVE